MHPRRLVEKNADFDQAIRARFLAIHQQATKGELFSWRSSAEGRLAEIIILDQFSRNMFRDTPTSFAYDTIALTLAQEGITQGADQHLSAQQKSFFYMPYMHSESPLIHEEAIKLFSAPGLENNLDFEIKHKAIIDRFGRYPHRNSILGRESSKKEQLFLQEPNSSF